MRSLLLTLFCLLAAQASDTKPASSVLDDLSKSFVKELESLNKKVLPEEETRRELELIFNKYDINKNNGRKLLFFDQIQGNFGEVVLDVAVGLLETVNGVSGNDNSVAESGSGGGGNTVAETEPVAEPEAQPEDDTAPGNSVGETLMDLVVGFLEAINDFGEDENSAAESGSSGSNTQPYVPPIPVPPLPAPHYHAESVTVPANSMVEDGSSSSNTVPETVAARPVPVPGPVPVPAPQTRPQAEPGSGNSVVETWNDGGYTVPENLAELIQTESKPQPVAVPVPVPVPVPAPAPRPQSQPESGVYAPGGGVGFFGNNGADVTVTSHTYPDEQAVLSEQAAPAKGGKEQKGGKQKGGAGKREEVATAAVGGMGGGMGGVAGGGMGGMNRLRRQRR